MKREALSRVAGQRNQRFDCRLPLSIVRTHISVRDIASNPQVLCFVFFPISFSIFFLHRNRILLYLAYFLQFPRSIMIYFFLFCSISYILYILKKDISYIRMSNVQSDPPIFLFCSIIYMKRLVKSNLLHDVSIVTRTR